MNWYVVRIEGGIWVATQAKTRAEAVTIVQNRIRGLKILVAVGAEKMEGNGGGDWYVTRTRSPYGDIEYDIIQADHRYNAAGKAQSMHDELNRGYFEDPIDAIGRCHVQMFQPLRDVIYKE